MDQESFFCYEILIPLELFSTYLLPIFSFWTIAGKYMIAIWTSFSQLDSIKAPESITFAGELQMGCIIIPLFWPKQKLWALVQDIAPANPTRASSLRRNKIMLRNDIPFKHNKHLHFYHSMHEIRVFVIFLRQKLVEKNNEHEKVHLRVNLVTWDIQKIAVCSPLKCRSIWMPLCII